MAQLRTFNAELAVDRPDYWRALIVATMSKPKVVFHPPKPWQESLLQKLQGPSNDREVIFVIDLEGNAGKTYFSNVFEQE